MTVQASFSTEFSLWGVVKSPIALILWDYFQRAGNAEGRI
jgi:hypothetical protein